MKTLVILSSILGNRSHSKELADHMVARIKQANPAAVITTRDIGAEPLPYFDGATAGALFTPADARTLEQQRIVERSDALVAELLQADRIVFAVPVYNFNLPAQFKSYLDHVARAGVTFRYTPEGVAEGLVIEQARGPAAAAGVQPGDVLLAINGAPAKNIEQVRAAMAKATAGKSVALLIERDGNKIFVPVRLG